MKVAQLKCADWDRNWLHFRGIGSTEPLTLNQSGINSRSGTEPANVGLVLQVSSFLILCKLFCLPLFGINIVSDTHVGLAYYILSISIYVIESDIGRYLCKYEYFEILYNLCTIFLKYSINKNLAPALALLGRYRSGKAMHRSSARSGGRILRIFPQYLRIFSHGVTTIRGQLFEKEFHSETFGLH